MSADNRCIDRVSTDTNRVLTDMSTDILTGILTGISVDILAEATHKIHDPCSVCFTLTIYLFCVIMFCGKFYI